MTNTTEAHIADPDGTTRGFVLASASPARRALLQGVGLEFEVAAADINEREVRDRLLALGTPAGEITSALAREKAEQVAGQSDDSLTIIAADQILLFEGDIFEKPKDREAARETLRLLRGKTHELILAVTAYRADREIWSCRESAHLTMRDFSDEFLEDYLRTDEGQLASVGAYRLEGRGAQLFSHIAGDFFTILGLPLLPVLEFLRAEGLARA